jgi:low temperature requirement protein LtrA
MLKKGLIKPPILRSVDRVEVERHATWLELLYDLVFVAAIAQLATSLSSDYSPAGFCRFGVIFIPVWWAWVGHTFYLSRFDTEDLLHRFLTMLQMTAVASLAVHVPAALESTSTGFALSYAAVRFILVAEYIRAGRHIPVVRPLTSRYVRGFGAAASLWALSALVPLPWRFWFWGVAMLVDFAAPLTAGQLHVRFPPHLSHLPERFGLFTIIVIGEAVASVVFGIGKAGLNPVSATAGLMGMLIAFALWWGYFEGARGTMTRRLQAREHVKYYQQWIYAHLPLLMGITAVAVGIKHVISRQAAEPLPDFEGWLLCSSVGVAALALSTIFLASTQEAERVLLRRLALPYYLIAFLGIAAGSLSSRLPALAVLGILTLLCVAQIVVSLGAVGENRETD